MTDPNTTSNMLVDEITRSVAERLAPERGLFVLGICGSQGSGKSTLAKALVEHFGRINIRAATLSLDDLYKTKTEREGMARTIHPLFRTRGVPGTHDVALGLEMISGLEQGVAVSLPRFDKSRDDRLPSEQWERTPKDVRILILEGWFVGLRPSSTLPRIDPINELEAREDADGRWRRSIEEALERDYQPLFSRLDYLALLAAPAFHVVAGWRKQQEEELRRAGRAAMSDDEIERFVQHYERLTRRALAEMPGYADFVIELDEDRNLVSAKPGHLVSRATGTKLCRGYRLAEQDK